MHAIFDGKPLIEDRIRIIDLAAAGACKIAAEQRLKHQDERIALTPRQMLFGDIAADTRCV
jgi:hypothetical protein